MFFDMMRQNEIYLNYSFIWQEANNRKVTMTLSQHEIKIDLIDFFKCTFLILL